MSAQSITSTIFYDGNVLLLNSYVLSYISRAMSKLLNIDIARFRRGRILKQRVVIAMLPSVLSLNSSIMKPKLARQRLYNRCKVRVPKPHTSLRCRLAM